MSALHPLQRYFDLMMAKVDKDSGLDGCWVFTGAKHSGGYGNAYVKRDGKRTVMTAHKMAYEVCLGPVPDGMVVRHMCDNRRCVNPDHLIPGTQKENMRDLRERGRGRNQYGQWGHDHSTSDAIPF